MKEFFELVDTHSHAAFWVGVFLLVGLCVVCNTAIKLVRGYNPGIVESERCGCDECLVSYNPDHDRNRKVKADA